jgi:hypothetical protein
MSIGGWIPFHDAHRDIKILSKIRKIAPIEKSGAISGAIQNPE